MKNKNLLWFLASACATGLGSLMYYKHKHKDNTLPLLRLTINNRQPHYIYVNESDYNRMFINKYKFVFDPILNREILKDKRMGTIYGCEIRIDNTIHPNFIRIEDEKNVVSISKFIWAVDELMHNDPEIREYINP